jgi:hypothetical protein
VAALECACLLDNPVAELQSWEPGSPARFMAVQPMRLAARGNRYNAFIMQNQVRLPVNGTIPLTAVQTPTATHSSAPLGTLEAHPVCSITKFTPPSNGHQNRGTDSVSRPLLAWSTKPIARFLRVFYTLRASSASSIHLWLSHQSVPILVGAWTAGTTNLLVM